VFEPVGSELVSENVRRWDPAGFEVCGESPAGEVAGDDMSCATSSGAIDDIDDSDCSESEGCYSVSLRTGTSDRNP